MAFRRILVPLDLDFPDTELEPPLGDGRETFEIDGRPVSLASVSLRALMLAAELCRKDGASLSLVHAVPHLSTHGMYHGPVNFPTKLLAEIQDRALGLAAAALQKVRELRCPDVAADVVAKCGNPHEVVLHEAQRQGADLIVLGAHDPGRIARFFIGSTTDRLIREAPCPVLVLPPAGKPAG